MAVGWLVFVTLGVSEGVGDNVGVSDGMIHVLVRVGVVVMVGVCVSKGGLEGMGGRVLVGVTSQGERVTTAEAVGVLFARSLMPFPTHSTMIPSRYKGSVARMMMIKVERSLLRCVRIGSMGLF